MTQPATQPTVNVPVVGRVQRRWVWVGAAAVAVIVGWAYLQRSRRPAVTYDPTTGSVDPGGTGYVNPAPGGTGSDEVVVDDDVIRTDAQWGAAAVAALREAGWNVQFAAVTIGKYLSGMTLTAEEANAVRAAWGLLGYPPSGKPIVTAPQQQPKDPPDQSTPEPPKNEPQKPKPKPPRRYVVVKPFTKKNPPWQSTLSGIAGRTGRSVSQLAKWNNIKDPDLIFPEQRIWIDPPGDYLGSTEFKG